MNKMPAFKKWWFISVGIFVLIAAVCVCYLAVGYSSLKRAPTYILIDFSLFPEHMTSEWIGWKWMPCKRKLAQRALYLKKPQEVQKDFRSLGFTLYDDVLGAWDITKPRNTSHSDAEIKMRRDIALFVHRSGVGVSWMGATGCTAIHEALLDSDSSSVKSLLEMERVDLEVPINPNASVKLCRLSVAALAKEKGISLNQ